ncbi:MAG: formate dehydrogenase accessory sulfurtransferase FdhD [Rhodocyclales bacterium]|nr:formate dehydrogenase accessory sulfurtransferase FdhD [Rhodocyclales bacterium]
MSTLTHLQVLRPDRGRQPDAVAEEVPVAFEYNGIAHAVMLATPADLEDLAFGFSLSEGIVPSPADVLGLDVREGEGGITLAIDIAGAAFAQLKERRRTLAGRTGCGLCGTESLAQVARDLAGVPPGLTFPLPALYEGMRRLPRHQHLQQATGAAHAAARIDPAGNPDFVREDVGRHNALDKTLGALLRSGGRADGALIVTSRASFEMVQKAAALGFGILGAVSAPTAAAVRLAERLGVTLVGFLRNDDCAVYCHAQRLQGLEA